ncbi:MAG: hypothetical protein U0325_33855 [Polyangiales bacterium]
MFAGLQDSDLDAYLPARAGSNLSTRPRLEVKQRLLSLTSALTDAAKAAGVALELRASDERPSIWNQHRVTAQWLWLWRDAEARRHLEAVLEQGRTLAATLTDPTPFVRHAFLALKVDAEGVEVSLRVHPDATVDLQNLRARAADPLKRAELLQALWSAGDLVLEVPGAPSTSARDVDGVRLQASLDALRDASQVWTLRALKVSRADVVARGAALGDDLVAAFARLLPLYRLVAWSADNDLVRVESAVAAAEAERAAHERETAAREAAWKAEHDAEIQRAREAAELRSHERAAAQERARPAVVQEAVKNLPKPEPEPVRPPPARPAPARPAVPKPAPPKPAVAKPAPTRVAADAPAAKPVAVPTVVAVGVKVMVVEGPFAGKLGTVLAIDARGAKVNFGPFSAHMALTELNPVAR